METTEKENSRSFFKFVKKIWPYESTSLNDWS